MLVPAIWGSMTPWTPPGGSATVLQQPALGTVHGIRYAHHHASVGGMSGMSYGRLRRWLRQRVSVLVPVPTAGTS